MSVAAELSNKGVKVKPEWLSACVNHLAEQQHEFLGLSDSQQAEKCFSQFLFSDLNIIGASSLPEEIRMKHKQRLQGPYVLQVDEVIDIGAAARQRYDEKGPEINSRCLKLSLTDGVQRIFAFEYKRVPGLQVHLPAGTKLVLKDVEVRRGTLLLGPENIEILGGSVHHLEAARLRALHRWLQPARGNRPQNGEPLRSLVEEATFAAWSGIRASAAAQEEVTVDVAREQGTRREPAGLQGVDLEHLQGGQSATRADAGDIDVSIVEEMLSPVHNGRSEVHDEGLFSYFSNIRPGNGQFCVKCVSVAVKEFQYKRRSTYSLVVYLDDGVRMVEARVAHKIVEENVGLATHQVESALGCGDPQVVRNTKDTLIRFQMFLASFEGTIILEQTAQGDLPLVKNLTSGTSELNMYLLLRRVLNPPPELSDNRDAQPMMIDLGTP